MLINGLAYGTRGSSSARLISTPIRRIPSGCCARTASGNVAATPPRSVMNSRRRMSCPRTRPTKLPHHWTMWALCIRSKIFPVTSVQGLGCAKTPARAAHVETLKEIAHHGVESCSAHDVRYLVGELYFLRFAIV